MSNAMTVSGAFQAPASSVFGGIDTAEDLSGGITGGYGLIKYKGKVWSIQYQGNSVDLIRDDGDGPRSSIEVVIVKANAHLSKTFYVNGYVEGSDAAPDCASANGIHPDAGVLNKQADVCATCPKNAWGSDPKGGKGKACGDHRRMAVVPLTDMRNEAFGGPLLLRCPAASLQDMAAFDSRYKAMGYPYFTMGIKISFDMKESFPKFVFGAIRPLTDDEARIVIELRNSTDVQRIISESTTPPPQQIVAPPAAAFSEPIPQNAVKPQLPPQTAPAAAAVQPQPAPAATKPQAAAAKPTVSTGFGVAVPATQPAQTQAAQAQPAAAAPQTRTIPPMTGFGGSEPATAEPELPLEPAASAADPAVVSAFEGSIDDRLNALLNG